MCNSLNIKTIRAGTRGVHWECCSLNGEGDSARGGRRGHPCVRISIDTGAGVCYARSVPYTLRHDICFLSICHARAEVSAPPALRLSVFDSDSVQSEHL